MRRNGGLVIGPLLAAAALASCGGSADEDGAAPAAAVAPAVGRAIGPQPGPDRPLPRMANPLASDPNARAEGRRLFRWYNCEGCHGGRGGGGMGPSLRDVHWIYGNHDEDVFNSIAEGRAHGMPAWGTKVPSEQIWKLVSYIQSLETANEPAPPPQNPSYPDPPPPVKPQTVKSYDGSS